MSNEKKGKELKLDNFKITGDIIKWNGSVIKIANISYVTNDKFELPAFPKLSVVLILFGLLLRSFNTAAFAGCVAAGIAWILYWYFEKEDLKNTPYENVMNTITDEQLTELYRNGMVKDEMDKFEENPICPECGSKNVVWQ